MNTIYSKNGKITWNEKLAIVTTNLNKDYAKSTVYPVVSIDDRYYMLGVHIYGTIHKNTNTTEGSKYYNSMVQEMFNSTNKTTSGDHRVKFNGNEHYMYTPYTNRNLIVLFSRDIYYIANKNKMQVDNLYITLYPDLSKGDYYKKEHEFSIVKGIVTRQNKYTKKMTTKQKDFIIYNIGKYIKN